MKITTTSLREIKLDNVNPVVMADILEALKPFKTFGIESMKENDFTRMKSYRAIFYQRDCLQIDAAIALVIAKHQSLPVSLLKRVDVIYVATNAPELSDADIHEGETVEDFNTGDQS